MERFAAEGLKAERDAYVKQAVKNKVPIFEIAEAYGLTEAEIGALITDGSRTMSQRDDIRDARSEPPKGGLIRGR